MEWDNEPERRKSYTLTEEQVNKLLDEAAKRGASEALKTLYADVGGSVVKKLAWAFAALLTAVLAYLTGSGHMPGK